MKIDTAGGTITAKTYEGYLYGLIKFGQSMERNNTTNPQGLNYITSTQSDDSLNLTVSVNFPFNPTIVNGSWAAAFTDYLTNVPFVPGTGDLKGTDWVSQIVECVTALDNAQASTTANPGGKTLINNYSFSSPSSSGTPTGSYSASFTIPLMEALNPDGSTSVSAKEVF